MQSLIYVFLMNSGRGNLTEDLALNSEGGGGGHDNAHITNICHLKGLFRDNGLFINRMPKNLCNSIPGFSIIMYMSTASPWGRALG